MMNSRTKPQSIVDDAIKANAMIASGIFLTALLVCAGSTLAWFAASPFVSDRMEAKISRPILPAASVMAGSLVWAAIAAASWKRWYKHVEP